MIVRILDEGQFEIDGAGLVELESSTASSMHAIETNDEEAFERSLRLLHATRARLGQAGRRRPIVPSDLTLPAERTPRSERCSSCSAPTRCGRRRADG